MVTNRYVLQNASIRAMIDLYGDTSMFDGLPEPSFSAGFERKLRQLTAHVRHNRYHRLTRTAKVILVAAILAALTVATVFAARQIGFSLFFIDGGRGAALDIEPREGAVATPIVCGYIPDGFVLQHEEDFKRGREKEYENGDAFIFIKKDASYSRIKADTEFREPRIVTHGKITYVIAGEEDSPIVLWMDPETQCLYTVYGGNIEENELLKVAFKTQ